MNAALPPRDLLLSRLLELSQQDGGKPCVCVRSVHAHQIKSVEIDRPTLILPLRGTKRVREHENWVQVVPGEGLLVPGARHVDMENIPESPAEPYEAVAIGLEAHVLASARQLLADVQFPAPGPLVQVPLDSLCDALFSWLDHTLRGDKVLACHAMTGVVLRLHALGYGGLLAATAPTLAQRIRDMVLADPSRDWSSPDLEAALGMSGATLRRQLAAAGTSLRDIIASARLAQALTLLISTRLPVKSVAQRVGYASAASFSKRFTERYGVEPSRVSSA
ncbi:helix-turn-helix transcriptional regulator [Viridibacterium curvum]|uniref:HTH araC/xylS-type domain-containing protein n=1 Tax=Viridibacterium curvum TaxID=1101404 RepID=A0ABP9QRI8_9RHOO